MIPIARPIMDEEEIQAVTEVLRSGKLTQGTKVKEFENKFASYIGTKYAVATSNGTTALHLALLVSDIGKNDEVITTPFTFISTANSILFCNAKPVFSDIDEKTFNIDPDLITDKITSRTKVLLVVHLYGQPCNMDPILDICHHHGLTLIEDACQAHGAEYKGQKVGSFGLGCFSFYGTKNMVTGEGGMVTTNDKLTADRLRVLRNHGQTKQYFHELLGYNYRMTDIAAAIGIYQLEKLEQFCNRRRENAEFLSNEIGKIKGLVIPYVLPEVKHVFHQYTIRVTKDYGISRDGIILTMKKENIETGIYYPIIIPEQPIYKKLGYNSDLPISKRSAAEVISLPIHPGVKQEEMRIIGQCLKTFPALERRQNELQSR
ncbi:DegT/DnrJ/EryC1/StrS family aminotransferase [Chloroflexota bacterium]